MPTRVLLRQQVELLAPKVASKRDVVTRASPKIIHRDAVGLLAREGRQSIGKARKAAGEGKRRRSPVHRVLIIPSYASVVRYILAIREVRRKARGAAAELVAKVGEDSRRKIMPPVGAYIEPQHIAGIEESEQVGIV